MDTDLQSVIQGLTPDELNQLRKMLGIRVKQEAKLKGDTSPKLKEPIVFFNDRYRYERFYVDGKIRKFSDGVFTAKTEAEAKAARALGAYVFEGQNLKDPIVCKVCQRRFYNNEVAIWHLQTQHAVA